MSEKLKSCPFCGNTPELSYGSGSYGYTPPTVGIRCCNGITIVESTEKWEQFKGTSSIQEEATKKVIEQWNKRAA